MITHKIIESIKEATCGNCIYSDGATKCYIHYRETELPFKPVPRVDVIDKDAWCPDGRWILPGDYYWQQGKVMTFQEVSLIFLRSTK